MKNSELLTAERRSLASTEKQQQYVLRSLVQKNPCPNCGHMLSFFEGAGIDIDSWEDKPGPTACRCVACNRELDYVVPVLAAGAANGGWHWHLVPTIPSDQAS